MTRKKFEGGTKEGAAGGKECGLLTQPIMNMTDREMADFLLKLRSRNEMPISQDEYYLIGDIAERLAGNSENEDSGRGCRYYEENGKKPCCTHSCHGCTWYY